MTPEEEAKAASRALDDRALRQYLETVLWSETDDNEEPLDRNFDINSFTSRAVLQAAAEMNAFLDAVDAAENALDRSNPDARDELDYDRTDLAHDFWLTRNGHGAGFWDKPEKYGPLADVFSELAERQGERHVYTTDPDEDGLSSLEFG